MSPMSAYEELVSHILDEEDREKFETFIGRVLSKGPRGSLIIEGPIASGKSTLMEIAQMVLKDVTQVAYHHDGFRMIFDETDYLFVSVLQNNFVPPNSVLISTNPKKLGPVEFHALMALVATESETISRLCREQYRRSTENQEN